MSKKCLNANFREASRLTALVKSKSKPSCLAVINRSGASLESAEGLSQFHLILVQLFMREQNYTRRPKVCFYAGFDEIYLLRSLRGRGAWCCPPNPLTLCRQRQFYTGSLRCHTSITDVLAISDKYLSEIAHCILGSCSEH